MTATKGIGDYEIKSGYAYKREPGGCVRWHESTSEDWEIVVVDAQRAQCIGYHEIDGVRMPVYETEDCVLYAQQDC